MKSNSRDNLGVFIGFILGIAIVSGTASAICASIGNTNCAWAIGVFGVVGILTLFIAIAVDMFRN